MPRRPDASCAGGCGTILWGGHGSLPAGERMCNPCRRRARTHCPEGHELDEANTYVHPRTGNRSCRRCNRDRDRARDRKRR